MNTDSTRESQGPADTTVGDRSIRQLLHAATGDRDAEAEALADEDAAVGPDDARDAVRRVHGDLGTDAAPVDHDVATPEDTGADDPGADNADSRRQTRSARVDPTREFLE